MATLQDRVKQLWNEMTPEERKESLRVLSEGRKALKNDPERYAKSLRRKSEAALIRNMQMSPEERLRINQKISETKRRKKAGLPPKVEPPVWEEKVEEEEIEEEVLAPYIPAPPPRPLISSRKELARADLLASGEYFVPTARLLELQEKLKHEPDPAERDHLLYVEIPFETGVAITTSRRNAAITKSWGKYDEERLTKNDKIAATYAKKSDEEKDRIVVKRDVTRRENRTRQVREDDFVPYQDLLRTVKSKTSGEDVSPEVEDESGLDWG